MSLVRQERPSAGNGIFAAGDRRAKSALRFVGAAARKLSRAGDDVSKQRPEIGDARRSSGMESAIRSAWVEPATIAHAKNTAVTNAAEVWFPCDKSRMSAAELCPPGTEFLDAETGHPKSPPETTCARRDQKELKPVAQIPAQTAYLNSTGNYPGSGRTGWWAHQGSNLGPAD